MARVRDVTSYRRTFLEDGWELLSVPPGLYREPKQLEQVQDGWIAALVPGTVIATLQQHRQWEIFQPLDVDATDWWYRCSFDAPLPETGKQVVLNFGGLATVADAWLNGEHILYAENMFYSYDVDVTSLLTIHNTLVIRFWSLRSLLSMKRPRPRWRTQLVDQQQLRWFRTTLLGKIPGWSPPVRPVGPWRSISLEERALLTIEQMDLRTTLKDGNGVISIHLLARNLTEQLPEQVDLKVGDATFPLHIQTEASTSFLLNGETMLSNVQQWWPHTHGEQPLYPAKLVLRYSGTMVEIDCGRIAFRHIELLRDVPDDFGLRVNGIPIFCRGACWTPLDMATLAGTDTAYATTLQMARQAGMNMLRVGGTMVYEADAFYDLCDELGIMVWQDFMFANMDYPTTNESFQVACIQECQQQLERLQTHPCITLFCGNSEIAQQAAMLGLAPEMWQNDFFYQVLPNLCTNYVDIPYWPSSPDGGTLPFQSNAGNSHYQGVGAFLRPLEDARRSEVRFATECLGFANVPEDYNLDLFLKSGEVVAHHPKWKARSPRDFGAGWDFDDIRDYYLELLFHVDPMKLRYSDTQRYLELSRVTTGEVMAYVFAEWRRKHSTCHGGLIWFYRDLWPGAGWGVIDSTGYPKAAYYYLRRVLLPQTCFFSDEGLNGLWLHIVNDAAMSVVGEVYLSLHRFSGTLMATATRAVTLPAHDEVALQVDALFAGFKDLTYAYRFGPPSYDIAIARVETEAIKVETNASRVTPVLDQAFYFPQGLPSARDSDIGLSAQATACSDGTYKIHIKTQRFAQSVAIRAQHFVPEDNYFHLRPGGEKTVVLYPQEKNASVFRCVVSALNTYHEIDVAL